MKTRALLAFALLGVMYFTACKNCPDAAENKALRDSLASLQSKALLHPDFIKSLLGGEEKEGGMVVDSADAATCMEQYKTEMKKRGIVHEDSAFATVQVSNRLNVTYSVKFLGKELLKWMNDEYTRLSAKGHIVHFRLVMGLYTSAFLLKYLPNDHEAQVKKLNRLTVFVVPYYNEKDAFRGDSAKVYDLGGLEP